MFHLVIALVAKLAVLTHLDWPGMPPDLDNGCSVCEAAVSEQIRGVEHLSSTIIETSRYGRVYAVAAKYDTTNEAGVDGTETWTCLIKYGVVVNAWETD